MKRVTLVIVAGVTLAAIGGVYVMAIALDPCSNTVIRTVFSPGRTYEAVLFERDCGATTGFSTQVSILPASSTLPNEPGNTFVADLKGEGPRGPWGGPAARLHWLSARKLQLSYDHTAHIFKREVASHGATIQYTVTR